MLPRAFNILALPTALFSLKKPHKLTLRDKMACFPSATQDQDSVSDVDSMLVKPGPGVLGSFKQSIKNVFVVSGSARYYALSSLMSTLPFFGLQVARLWYGSESKICSTHQATCL